MKIEKISRGEVLLIGELTIRHAVAVRDVLLALIGENNSVKVRIDPAAEVDPAFLQLLCSAHRIANLGGKSLILDLGDGSKLKRQLEDVGFIRHVGCLLDCNNDCVWATAAQQ